MRILEIISDLFAVGGGQTFTVNLSIALKKMGNEVTVLSLYKEMNSFFVEQLKSEGIVVISLNKRKGIDFKCAKELKKAIIKLNPDVIHAHLSTYLTLYLSGILKTKKIIYTFHSIINKENSGSPHRLDNFLIKKLIKQGKIIPIGISNLVSKSISSFYRVPKPFVIMNGVDINRFSPSKDFRQNRDIDFLVVGSFSPIKNQLIILKAFENLSRQIKCSICFVGDGALRSDCEEYAQINKIPNVKFMGNVTNVHDYLRKTKFLVLCSSFEGNPMVINEAIASGAYVLSNDVGGIPDLVTDETTGRLFHHTNDDLNELTNLMKECVKKYPEISNAVTTNLELNRKRVSIENSSNSYYRFFEHLQ